VDYYAQKAELPGLKVGARPALGTVHSQVLQDVVLRLKKAFDDFFERRSPQQSRIVTVSEAQLGLYLNGASGDIGAKPRSEYAGGRLVLIENAAKARIGGRVIGNSKIRMIEQIEEL